MSFVSLHASLILSVHFQFLRTLLEINFFDRARGGNSKSAVLFLDSSVKLLTDDHQTSSKNPT
jgi:hypothetical protein